MSSVPSWLAFLAATSLACSPGPITAEPLSEAAVSPKTQTSIGIAPFEPVGAAGAEVPDVASLLAQRLGTRGVKRVVGPEELHAAALGEPTAKQVVGWASQADVEVLVVGRTTRLGERLSVDARLRSGRSGDDLGSPFYAAVASAEDLPEAVDRLAGEVLARLDAPPPAAVAPGPAAAENASSGFQRDDPISIHADELEALQRPSGRQFVFTGHVRAEQADITLESERLEALYPPGASQPDRLVATGHVVLVQGDRRATCDRAVFLRDEGRLICTGRAQLDQGCDRVQGDEIVFELESELLKVKGSAGVRVHPHGAGCETRAEARR